MGELLKLMKSGPAGSMVLGMEFSELEMQRLRGF